MSLSEENEKLAAETIALKKQAADKALHLEKAGSIAEAALQVNGVFEAAEKAAAQYVENLKRLSNGAQAEADALMAQVQRKCVALEQAVRQRAREQLAQTQQVCNAMTAEAKSGADAQWASVKERLDAYIHMHEGLREQFKKLHSA